MTGDDINNRERRETLVDRLVVVKSELFTAAVPDTPVVNWTLDDLAHHIRQVERLVGRLHKS